VLGPRGQCTGEPHDVLQGAGRPPRPQEFSPALRGVIPIVPEMPAPGIKVSLLVGAFCLTSMMLWASPLVQSNHPRLRPAGALPYQKLLGQKLAFLCNRWVASASSRNTSLGEC
jgi:hypothetical protein